ncbi:MAG: hypothetical protein LBK13_04850 [Spirochaetales bacterium]|jgi:hypothetical protein|nr:hypothetical protein [Spirochaetales bacterium]
MKKNYTIVFAFIAALIALCAFWGCSSSDDDDGNDFGDDGVPKSIKVTDFYDMDGSGTSKVKYGITATRKAAAAIAVSDFEELSAVDAGYAEAALFTIADAKLNPTGTAWTGTGTYYIFIAQYDEHDHGFPWFFSKEKIKINSARTTLSYNDFREFEDGEGD